MTPRFRVNVFTIEAHGIVFDPPKLPINTVQEVKLADLEYKRIMHGIQNSALFCINLSILLFPRMATITKRILKNVSLCLQLPNTSVGKNLKFIHPSKPFNIVLRIDYIFWEVIVSIKRK